jgi:RNA polymerase sigma-70 factor (ECF subfamily)
MMTGKEGRREDALLEMASQGSRTGLEYLVNTYQNLAYTVAIKIVMNKEDAEEVVQDSFMKAFAGLKNFKRASKFSTWLYRIVYNTALTKMRGSHASTTDLNLTPENQTPLMLENAGYDLLKDNDRKKYVNLALRRLSPEDHTIISLYYLGDKEIVDICEIMGLNKSAVKMRLLRARKQLHAEFERLLNTEKRNLL